MAASTGPVAIGSVRHISNVRSLRAARRADHPTRSTCLQVAAKANSSAKFYKVQPNDSLFAISKRYDVSWKDIRDANLDTIAATRNIDFTSSSGKKALAKLQKDQNWTLRIDERDMLMIPNAKPQTRKDAKALTDGPKPQAAVAAVQSTVQTTMQAAPPPPAPRPLSSGGMGLQAGVAVGVLALVAMFVEAFPATTAGGEQSLSPPRTQADVDLARSVRIAAVRNLFAER